MEIETLKSRVVYKNRWMTVREDLINRGEGKVGIYGVVDKLDFAIIIPVENQRVYLVEQFRYPVKKRFWEFPQGSWEHYPEAKLIDVARGELKEETGLSSADMKYLGYLHNAYGYSSQRMHIFLAKNFQKGQRELSVEEQDLITKSFSFVQFEEMIVTGKIKDAATLAAYTFMKIEGLF